MQPDTLLRLGPLLFGSGWKTALAERLDVNHRTVERWGAGRTAIPPWLSGQLLDIARERREKLDEAIRELR